MKPQLAYDAIALEFGSTTVFLRPSLRAATHLERLHGGFPALLRKIEEFDTRTICQIITQASGMQASAPLLLHAAKRPLSEFQQAIQGPCFELVAAFFPEAPANTQDQPNNTPTPWGEFFQELYGFATGWLGWPPETAWQATPKEIIHALEAHVAKLTAIYGGAEEPAATTQSEEQRRQNVELGLDPNFDREGLRALKELAGMREGMAV